MVLSISIKIFTLFCIASSLSTHASPRLRDKREIVYIYAGDPEFNTNTGDLWEGDMIILDAEGVETDDNWLSQKTTRFHERTPWDNSVVPYTFDDENNPNEYSALTDSNGQEIHAAMNDIERVSCVRFTPHTGEDGRQFLHIRGPPKIKNQCASTVGMRDHHAGNTMLLGPGCFQQRGFILHQLMHVLGFYHEHTRTDRDDWIFVEQYNIVPPTARQYFMAYTDPQYNHMGQQYDYGSVMHWSQDAYTTLPNVTTLSVRNQAAANGVVVGQRDRLSAGDIAKINALYCNNSAPIVTQQQPAAAVPQNTTIIIQTV